MTAESRVKASVPGPDSSRGTPPADVSVLRAACVGVLSAAVAVAVGQLVAGLLQTRSTPVIVVGNQVIDRVPRAVKDWAIDVFGTSDKLALLVGIHVLLGLASFVVGVIATRRFWIAALLFAAFGAVGVLAGLGEEGAGAAEIVPSIAAAAGGVVALAFLVRVAKRPTVDRAGADLVALDSVDRSYAPESGRRAFVLACGASLAVAAGAIAIGRVLQSRVSSAASRLGVRLPRAAEPLPPLPADADLGVAGVAPFITPNDSFYRIDVNLLIPQIEAESWTLRIFGSVDREIVLTYNQLLERPMVEADLTLACVSNEIGDELVGNARWLGTPLLPLLEEAGIQPGTDQVVGRAVDNFTVGFPLTALQDGRTALVAIGMNGEPLPIAHGFPARLLVAGLYGYVSATKWLGEIQLTRFADFDAYWVPRGWAPEAPIKTMSRIDTPRAGARLAPGPVAIGGVAWAPTLGIDRVEVRVDAGRWVEAELAGVPSDETWRQWFYRWDAAPGDHRIVVRATDGDGHTQTEREVPPFPDGATGWHSVGVVVGNDD